MISDVQIPSLVITFVLTNMLFTGCDSPAKEGDYLLTVMLLLWFVGHKICVFLKSHFYQHSGSVRTTDAYLSYFKDFKIS